jgi:eukaryotic-like serine/threonine-protein kinase
MSLSAGTRIGPYEVQAPLGAGGMGEVYRARDTKLARDVALKILPAEFALDADRVARFTREAQMLAALNHQNIAGIYGLEDGPAEAGHYSHALVLEFVDGPTLADRIAQGPLSIDDALPIARQIAEALEAAHEQGIIHRDLKPANIKVRPDGMVKVLDFGLAKLATGVSHAGPREQGPAYTVSPTITTPAMTQVGMILGTAAYMSPEQAKGREADKRSDIWALGCVLFEMLTGARAFAGDDVSDTLAAVLRADPDWSALPSSTPRAIRTLLRRSLEKDRKRRLADAADARLEIEEALATPRGEPNDGAHRRLDPPLWRSVLTGAGALVLGGLTVGLWMRSQQPPAAAPPITRFAIPLEGQRLYETGSRPLAISPDGRRVVFAADRRLYVRALEDLTATPLTGTEVVAGQVASPVFSPDSRSIAYMGGRPAGLKRIAVTGGAPITLCEACGMVGTMSWDREGIVFIQLGQGTALGFPARGIITPGTLRIMRLSPDGGEPRLLLNVTDGTPWDVQLLPGGGAVLFDVVTDSREGIDQVNRAEGQVVVQAVGSDQRKVLVANGSAPRYVNTGHIVYTRQGILFAKRFDLDRLEASGEEVPVLEGVRRPAFVGGAATRAAYFDVSDTGSLVYIPGPPTTAVQYDLAVLDPRQGLERLELQANAYQFPRVSPDGKSIALQVDSVTSTHVWIYERSGGALRQLTSAGRNRTPVWSADSRSLSFQSDREGDRGIWRQPANGSQTPERLTTADADTEHVPDAWSPDGRTLLFEIVKGGERTLWALSVADKKLTRVGDITSTYSIDATLSPNGRWLAYRSPINIASGVTVEPFPTTGAKFPIDNGIHPTWAGDGKTLFFRRLTTGEFVSLPVTTEAAFTFGKPEELPSSFNDRMSNSGRRSHDITPDGKFVGVVSADSDATTRTQINVVVNWFEELKQRLPR